MTDMSDKDPDAIREDIERTRDALGSDVDALADKVTPSKIVEREKAKVKGAIGSVKDRVFGVAADASDTASDAASSVGDAIASAPRKAVEKAEGAPIAVGLIAFGVGLMVASLIPASTKEKELAGSLKDAAQPLLDEAADAAKDVAANLKEPAADAFDAVKSQAVDSAETVKAEATGAVDDVKDDANQAKHVVQDSTK